VSYDDIFLLHPVFIELIFIILLVIILQTAFVFNIFDYVSHDTWFVMQDLGLSHLYFSYSLLVFLFLHGLVALFSHLESGL
jgi:hypothetical protein